MESVSHETLTIAREFVRGDTQCADGVSPLLLDWLYRSAATFIMLYRESPCERYLDSKSILQEALKKLSLRWATAGVYLQFLEVRDLANVPLQLLRTMPRVVQNLGDASTPDTTGGEVR